MSSVRTAVAAGGLLLAALLLAATSGAQHGGRHLPAVAVNVQLVGKLRLTERVGGVGDVAARKGFAYVAAWRRECPNAGVHVVDIRNPAAPRKVAFVPAPEGYHVGEGVHVIAVRTASFRGDILLTNHEACPGNAQPASGGFSLIDVTRPAQPRRLTGVVGDDVMPEGGIRPAPNAAHSVQGWTTGKRAYAVVVDNIERDRDVDVFEITNPRRPRQVGEVGLARWPRAAMGLARGHDTLLHDMQVARIGGHWLLLLSYWDAGWILLNVDRPARPVFVRSYRFPSREPLMPFSPPEGNAHQAFWSSNRQFILAANEDLFPHRGQVTTAASPGERFDAELAGTAATPAYIQSGQLGDVPRLAVYVGLACGTTPRAPTPGAIAVIERGDCGFTEKVDRARGAGYAAAIVFNAAMEGGCEARVPLGGVPAGALPTFGVARSIGYRILGVPGYDPARCPSGANPALPAVGARLADLLVQAVFDGWGYLTLLDARSFRELGFYAVREGVDAQFALGIGWLSIHEVKTDPRPGVNLAYVSYYAAGARVVRFGRSGLREVGAFIDEGGNDFWGTFPIRQGSRAPLWLLSDRDFGLYVLRYTGPR